MRAANGSPLTVNTFVFAILLLEGMQLHLGLRVVNIFPTFFWDIPSYKNTIPLLIGLREACAYANGTVFMLRKLWPPPFFGGAQPPRAYAIAFRVRILLLPKHVLVHFYSSQLHKYPLLGRMVTFVRATEALDVSLLNLILKTDDAKWLCLW